MQRVTVSTWAFRVCLVAGVACSSSARAPARTAPPEASEEAAVAPGNEPGATAPVAEDDGDPQADEAYDYRHESLGELTFELDAAGVEGILGAPSRKGPVAKQDADGSYRTRWLWSSEGVEVGMSAEAEHGPFRVSSIAVGAPSRLRTSKGIGLGSTPSEIEAAYGGAHTHVEASSVLVGSAYGGLYFELEDGKVSSIFVGASAE